MYRYLTERLDLTSGVSSQAVLLLLSMYLSLRSYLPQYRILLYTLGGDWFIESIREERKEGRTGLDLT